MLKPSRCRESTSVNRPYAESVTKSKANVSGEWARGRLAGLRSQQWERQYMFGEMRPRFASSSVLVTAHDPMTCLLGLVVQKPISLTLD